MIHIALTPESVMPLTASENFGDVSQRMSKIVDQLQRKGYSNFYSGESWSPNLNLYETDSAYVVCVDLAGVQKEKIDLEVEDGVLTLRGHRAVPTEFDPVCIESKGRCKVHLMEIDHGSFRRKVEMPADVEKSRINATYRNGLLWIELPKK